jgi:hypothetical protein
MKALCLQGGGILGYGQSVMLSELESGLNSPSSGLFDIIGGTSVGSIVGAHLALGIPASTCKQFFTTHSPLIFKKNWLSLISVLWGAKYNSSIIEAKLQECLGDATLADCKTRFIATSYDWATDRPVYFKSFEKSSETKDWVVLGYDSPIKLWQVCRASSAAQTYFPAYKYQDMILMDGGNIGDNACDMLVISECAQIAPLTEWQVLSLGAGDTVWKERPSLMVNPSAAVAGLATIKIIFSAGESSDVYKAYQILGDKNYLRVSPDLGNGYAIDDASVKTLNALGAAADKAGILKLFKDSFGA